MSRDDQRLMKMYGIHSSTSRVWYHFGGCAYEQLEDAVRHAKIVLQRSSGVLSFPPEPPPRGE
jgi:hypothetical protein